MAPPAIALVAMSCAFMALAYGQTTGGMDSSSTTEQTPSRISNFVTDFTSMGPTSLYANYTWPPEWDNNTETGLVTCTKIFKGEFMFEFRYTKTDGTMSPFHQLYVPSDGKIIQEESACLNVSDMVPQLVNTNSDNDHYNATSYNAYTTVGFLGDTQRFTFYFSNNSNAPYNVPGWFQFSVWKISVQLDMTQQDMKAHFPDSANETLFFEGMNDNDDVKYGRWWKQLGAYSNTTYQCDKNQYLQVTPDLYFHWQNLEMAALNYGDHFLTNDTYEPNRCNFDYEKNDKLAVIIGSVQTGFTLLFLGLYFVYLKKRGPVKVPKWIVEPAMRNAEVKPIEEHEYERRMSQLNGDDTNGVPTKRPTATSHVLNGDGEKY